MQQPDRWRDFEGVVHVVRYRLGNQIALECGRGFWRTGPNKEDGFEYAYEAPTCLECIVAPSSNG